MKVAVCGTGNVGWALVENLTRVPKIDEIMVLSRDADRVRALAMDIASADPEAADKIKSISKHDLAKADIIVLTSGAQMKKGESASDVFESNLKITRSLLDGISLKPCSILITLATPVDDITVFAQLVSGLPRSQVFGFGGDLDLNRLKFVLNQRMINPSKIRLIGEHGGNAIPVYDDEVDYNEVANDVRTFLRTVTSLAGQPKNLATARLLTELIQNILTNSGQVHCLCGYHPDYDLYLTWPFRVGRQGIIHNENVAIAIKAKSDLETLVARRKNTLELIRTRLAARS